MLAVWSRSYFASQWCVAELETFTRRSRIASATLVVPVVIYGGGSLPR
jgi:hypothetical protein